jgi:hypothetical protein
MLFLYESQRMTAPHFGGGMVPVWRFRTLGSVVERMRPDFAERPASFRLWRRAGYRYRLLAPSAF